MKLYELILRVKGKMDYATDRDIIEAANFLQSKINKYILAPAGIKCDLNPLNENSDMNTKLLLDGEYAELYIYYIMAMISAGEADTVNYENYMKLFNTAYLDFAIHFRRNNCPVGSVKIGGSNI